MAGPNEPPQPATPRRFAAYGEIFKYPCNISGRPDQVEGWVVETEDQTS
jgi:hypothetical protein